MPTLWTSQQLTDHEFPEPAYLVDPVIPQGGIAILHGKPGVGKSQLALTLVHAINNGLPFLDRWETRKGRVVYIQADMTTMIQQDRLIKVARDVDLSDTYWVVEEDGSVPLVNIETMKISNRTLMKQIQEIDPLLIIWDTLRKVHRLPENASESAVTVFQSAQEICPRAAHLFLHHNRKESKDPDAIQTLDEDFMGNIQWQGSADATFSLREIANAPKRMILEFHKARTAPDTAKQPIILELDMKTILLQSTEL